MRIRDLLRLAGAAVLATTGLLAYTTSASAFVGLSDKQKAHIEEYIHCKILLLTDLAAFEAEQPPCGGKPNTSLNSLAPTGSGIYRRSVCGTTRGETLTLSRVVCE